MAKLGKLTKLKSAMKKMPSFTRLSRTTSTNSLIAATDCVHKNGTGGGGDDHHSKELLHAVYVGKSRRRYYLSSDVICHPLFQELIERSGGFDDGEVVVVAACEVVLFEHLLWMLESGTGADQLGSMQELVEFYTC